MRMPIKSEADAFRVAFGAAALIGLSVAAGAVIAPLVGVALLVGGILGALYLDYALEDRDRPAPLADAERAARTARTESAGTAAAARKRILVVANQTLGGVELKEEILRRGEPRPELRIVAPVLASRSHYLTSDIDRELGEARERLDSTLQWAHEQGFEAVGMVGADSPLIAIEDALRRYGADELIISTHIPERSHWLESGVVERARAQLDIPVTHVVVDVARQQVKVAA
jgi:GABA permease